MHSIYSVRVACPVCGVDNLKGSMFCGGCGMSLHAQTKPTSEAPEIQRPDIGPVEEKSEAHTQLSVSELAMRVNQATNVQAKKDDDDIRSSVSQHGGIACPNCSHPKSIMKGDVSTAMQVYCMGCGINLSLARSDRYGLVHAKKCLDELNYRSQARPFVAGVFAIGMFIPAESKPFGFVELICPTEGGGTTTLKVLLHKEHFVGKVMPSCQTAVMFTYEYNRSEEGEMRAKATLAFAAVYLCIQLHSQRTTCWVCSQQVRADQP